MKSIKCVGIFGSVLSLSCYYKSKYSISNIKEKVLSYSPRKVANAAQWNFNWDGREENNFGDRTYHFICPYKNPAQNQRFLNDIRMHIIDSKMLSNVMPLTYISSEEHRGFVENLKSMFAPAFYDANSHYSKVLNDVDLNFTQPEINPQNEHQNFVNRSILEYAFKKYICRGVSSRRIMVASPDVVKFMLTRAIQLPLESCGRFDVKEGTVVELYVTNDGRVYFYNSNPFSPKLNELFKQELL